MNEQDKQLLEQRAIVANIKSALRDEIKDAINVQCELRDALRADAEGEPAEGGSEESNAECLDKILQRLEALHARLEEHENGGGEERDDAGDDISPQHLQHDPGLEHSEVGRNRMDSEFMTMDQINDIANKCASLQVKADKYYSLYNDSAPRAVHGEKPTNFRKRLLSGLQRRSCNDAIRKIDLLGVADDATLDYLEGQIFADADLSARNPSSWAPETDLMEIKTPDASGRVISTFHSRSGPRVWMDQFSCFPGRRMLAKIQGNRGE
jgi:hypothetical protein